jgi:hypothetical protein
MFTDQLDQVEETLLQSVHIVGVLVQIFDSIVHLIPDGIIVIVG